MCRYAFIKYKPHYACFKCRKTYKRRLLSDISSNNNLSLYSKCPQCENLMADMGLDFKAPKRGNLKSWKHLELLFKIGITFHSCGCCGPGYIPQNKEELLAKLYQQKNDFQKNLNYWRDKQNNSTNKINNTYETRTPILKNQEDTPLNAIEYWYTIILAIEKKSPL